MAESAHRTAAPPIVDCHFDALRHGDAARPALAAIRLRIAPGERVLVCGADGAGKTTLVRLLAGVLDTDRSGFVTIDASEVAVMFADPQAQLVAGSCAEEVAAGLEVRAVPADLMHAVVPRLLAAVGLADRAADPPSVLSGGERQRLVLAAVLAPILVLPAEAAQRALILLDEPTSHLDPHTARIIDDLLDWPELRDCSVVITSADPGELRPGWRVIALDAGHIHFDGAAADLLAHPGTLEALGLGVPDPARLALELADRGVALAGIPFDAAELLALLDDRISAR